MIGWLLTYSSYDPWTLCCLSLPDTLESINVIYFFFLFFFCFFYLFIYLFIYLFMAALGLRFCARAFSRCGKWGATLHRGARASHHRGLSCGAQAPDAQAQQPWLTGPVAPRHAGSSQTRARTRVPCIGRQTLNHCATREALNVIFAHFFFFPKQ